MELRQALMEQYHAGLAMLAECVAKCPEGIWLKGEHPRTFWRIAFHAAFFTQLYLGQNEAAFQPWPRPVHWARCGRSRRERRRAMRPRKICSTATTGSAIPGASQKPLS